jgi:hypothetical protein
MNKHAEYYENLDLLGCFGDQGSLEVVIGDHGSLEVAHILFFCFFYYLIVSMCIHKLSIKKKIQWRVLICA